MAADNILRSYGDSSAKEDVVLNAIEILTAREEQIFNMLGKTEAIDTTHHYLTDTLASPGSSAVSEGEDYSANAVTTPTRLSNIVEIVARPFKVSRTQQQIEHYHGENELQRQTRKALMEWGNSAEFDLVRSTLTSGASGTAPKMSKILKWFNFSGIMKLLCQTKENVFTAINKYQKKLTREISFAIESVIESTEKKDYLNQPRRRLASP
jgi:hypothetical protein